MSSAPNWTVKRWKDFETWTAVDDADTLNARFSSVRLQDLVSRRLDRLELVGSFGDAYPITVHLTGAISVRKRSSVYKGHMFAAYPGDVVISKIDARNGAVGVIPQEISKAVVTSEFPVFTPRLNEVSSDYLKYIIRTGNFLSALNRRASGTSGRKRITPQAFLDLRVPLTSLEEQQRLVERYHAECGLAEELRSRAGELEDQGMREFEAGLGFVSSKFTPDETVVIARFSELERWSHDWVVQFRRTRSTSKVGLPTVDLYSIGEIRSGLTKSPQNRAAAHSRHYLSVANVQRWSLALDEVKKIDVPDEDMHSYRLRRGDVLVCEGGGIDQVGRAALWNDEIEDCVHQNHIFRVRVDTRRISPSFLVAVLNSSYGQRYFRMKAKRTTIASINRKDLSMFPLPLPPLGEQNILVERLQARRSQARRVLQQSVQMASDAWNIFTSSIYG